ncbi:glycosyltransferase family 1 protein [Methylomagnum ishizawai]|uniref:glycosyltransferase family 1 protein n=1 Tax=Methylomagnum ishizawai TaxID=1760988 RepID=UPI001594D3A8|nr:glycosyltransferase family 1 protein [Methylomagnum ishizawai]
MAKRFPVVYVEEPIFDPDALEPRWELARPQPGVMTATPVTAIAEPGFNARQRPLLETLLARLVEQEKLVNRLVWPYTPLALPLARGLKPLGLIYDVMDEVSAFKGAPPGLLDREAEAYRTVDLVFTGGPSLHRAKQGRHPNVHCFPSSVDLAHFGQARRSGLDHAGQAGKPRPRLGFFGVIDERLDLPLLDALVRARPDWQLMMVGPVTKISPQDLPQAPNLHYFGQRAYAELPAFLAGWDVCLLPFALNDATRYISPTKTLEYMAAEKPADHRRGRTLWRYRASGRGHRRLRRRLRPRLDRAGNRHRRTGRGHAQDVAQHFLGCHRPRHGPRNRQGAAWARPGAAPRFARPRGLSQCRRGRGRSHRPQRGLSPAGGFVAGSRG